MSGPVEFAYTPEQDALRESVQRFVLRDYGWERRFEIVRAGPGQEADHWPLFAELGWLGAGLSEDEGGFGGGAVENALIAEELGVGLVIAPFAAHVAAVQALAALGGDRATALVAAAVMGETRLVPAWGETEARGDWRIVATRAALVGEGARLSGTKTLVDGAARADAFLVSARDESGIGLYLVAADAEGFSRRDYRTLDNHRVAELRFDRVVAERLATGEAAIAAVERGVDHAVLAMCGEAVGIMFAAIAATRDYLKVRRQFGTALGDFQALQHRMADMLIEAEMARSILFHALGAATGGDPKTRALAVSAAKVQVGEAGMFVGRQAIQLHGAIGVTEELIVSHWYRRLYVIARLHGDAELHTDRFARLRDDAIGD